MSDRFGGAVVLETQRDQNSAVARGYITRVPGFMI
jgi:hypothetical protein